jgi:hypothetical protein
MLTTRVGAGRAGLPDVVRFPLAVPGDWEFPAGGVITGGSIATAGGGSETAGAEAVSIEPGIEARGCSAGGAGAALFPAEGDTTFCV